MVHRQGDALALVFWENRIAQETWLCVVVTTRPRLSIAYDDNCCVPRVLSSPPSHVFVRLWLYILGVRIGSVGFLGGPAYQAGRLLGVEVTGLSPAAVSSVLAFCSCKQEPWAASTATEYRCISRGGLSQRAARRRRDRHPAVACCLAHAHAVVLSLCARALAIAASCAWRARELPKRATPYPRIIIGIIFIITENCVLK